MQEKLGNKEQFVREWNNKHPYDRWWRKKYNVPFGSKIHLEANFIDMAIEFAEDMYFANLKRMTEEDYSEQEREVDALIESSSIKDKTAVPVVKMNVKEIDKEFANMNLEQFNEKQ